MLKTGDLVCFLNEEGNGRVVKVINSKRVVVDFEGIEIPADTDDLILLERPGGFTEQEPDPANEPEAPKEEDQAPDFDALLKKDFSERKKTSGKKFDLQEYARSLSVIEVDLHIEKLEPLYHKLNNAQMLELQLRHFEKYMDKGFSGKHRRIIFIHGVGNGVLKREINARLQSCTGIRYSDASISTFGFGATEVVFES